MQFDEGKHRIQALLIIEKLAAGYDPQSGEALGPEHILHRPEVIRALVLALHSLESRTSGPGRSAERAGAAWGKNEDTELRELFASRVSLQEIANSLQRTRGSITARLVRLQLVESREDARKLLASGTR